MSKLTRFEITRIISARALQLSLGAPAFVKVGKDVTMLNLARLEFDKKVIPIAVVREFPDGHVERTEVN
ncbi:MAG: DNA-directed RNA polymerase subunit K [Candidatus Diapherotrites archaeon CG11_big_fil_rev_8_21_14_0_20_37_9]|nr:MAG: DNA-directed RNA polymerase subunit K [Candidatus Diapherotrites archaeon CG11_big_fil_rev_8_21_14_0_20_37_9]